MLDNLYENIGGKIKNWAKWIFIVEAIGSIITAIVLPNASGDPDDFILISLLIAIVGPIVAWVGSWILYAFGELVEDVHAIRNKEGTTKETSSSEKETLENNSQTTTDNSNINLRKATQCECGELYYGLYCPICGKNSKTQNSPPPSSLYHTETESNKTTKKSYVCKCGERFYGETCPNCGRTFKDL